MSWERLEKSSPDLQGDGEISPEVRAEVLHRRDEPTNNPEWASSGAAKGVEGKLADAATRQASAG